MSAGAALLIVLGLMLVKLGMASAPAWSAKGSQLLFSRHWAPGASSFGALPMLYGTLVTSAIALLLAVPIGVGTALYIAELAPRRLRAPVAALTDLLAAVPSVVYGLWGVFVLVPAIRPLQQFLARTLGSRIPLFAGPAPGISYLTAGVVLAIMILPTISAVSREVIGAVPRSLREAALSLGATSWESMKMAVLPAAKPGIIGAIILGLGRAFGETIAVTMVIGNSPMLNKSLLAPGYTMASVIANEFSEATSPIHVEALIAIALMLFAVTLVINIGARLLVGKAATSAVR